MGGAEFLLVRVGSWLLAHGMKVALIDYKTGFLARNLPDVPLIEIENRSICGNIEEGILLAPASLYFSLHKLDFLSPEVKVFLWIINPTNIYPTYPGLGRLLRGSRVAREWVYSWIMPKEIRRIKRIYSLLDGNKALTFMDGSCLDFCSSYAGELTNLNFLQIPINVKEYRELGEEGSQFNCKKIRMGWVGRIDSRMKLPVLKILLRDADLFGLKSGLEVVFDIVGEGDGLSHLQRYANKFSHLTVRFQRSIPNEQLGPLMRENFDILFAMGTAALEGGVNGIPTVLVDICTKTRINYRYRWLFETLDYSLGHVVSRNQDVPAEAFKSMNDLMTILFNQRDAISIKCRNYVLRNHEIDVVGVKLLELLERSTLTMGVLRESGLLGGRRFF